MNAWNVPQVTRTTATAVAGILVALNLKFKLLPLTVEDTASVAGVLVFLTQIFQRQGTKKAENAAKNAYNAALGAQPGAVPGWGVETPTPGWSDAADGWGTPAPPPAAPWSEAPPNPAAAAALDQIMARLEALEKKG